MMLEIVTRDEEETLALGRLIGALLEPGAILGLSGDLGAGKTVLVRGLAEGLGVDPEVVRSPTFTLMVTYAGGRLPLHHLDLYRLSAGEDDRLALREVLDGDGVAAVEWFEHLGESPDHLRVEIEILAAQPHARRIRLSAGGDAHAPLVEAVRSRWL
jgi:tRNA threonylcarbamoyladenosine biosynthesis protein TsaE